MFQYAFLFVIFCFFVFCFFFIAITSSPTRVKPDTNERRLFARYHCDPTSAWLLLIGKTKKDVRLWRYRADKRRSSASGLRNRSESSDFYSCD